MQTIVVEDERLPIGGFLHVQLEAMPGSDGGLERRHAVFHPPVAVQPTVREGPGDQPEQPPLAARTQCLNLRIRRRLHSLDRQTVGYGSRVSVRLYLVGRPFFIIYN